MKRFLIIIFLLLLAKIGSAATYITITGPSNGLILSYPYLFGLGVDYSNISLLGRFITQVDYIINDGASILSNTNSPYGVWYAPVPITINHINERVDAKLYTSDGNVYPSQNPIYISRLSTPVQITGPVDGGTIYPGSAAIIRAYVDYRTPNTGLAFSINNGSIFVQASTTTDAYGTKSWIYNWNGIAAGSYSITAIAYDGLTQTRSPTINITSAYAPPTISSIDCFPSTTIVNKSASLTANISNGSTPGTVTQTWAVSGPAAVSLVGQAKATVYATFSKAGAYTFTCTAKNQSNLTVSSSKLVTVQQVFSSMRVLAGPATSDNTKQQFLMSASDQFLTEMNPSPTITWNVSGGGTISPTGLFTSTAGASVSGPFVVSATSGTVTGIASVRTGPELVSITGDPVSINGSKVTLKITISGAPNTQSISLTGALFANNTSTTTQSAGTSTSYDIFPAVAATAISIAVGGVPSTVPSLKRYNIVISDVVRGTGLPSSMTINASRALTLVSTPALPTGVQVEVMVLPAPGSSANSGLAEVVNGANTEVVLRGAGGAFTITSFAQSDPGGLLNVVAFRSDTQTVAARGKPFTVCAHPQTWVVASSTFEALGPGGLHGMVTTEHGIDDSSVGSTVDLGNCLVLESVQKTLQDPAFMGGFITGLTGTPITMFYHDENAWNESKIQRTLGTFEANQLMSYECTTCGITHYLLIPKSGFLLHLDTYAGSYPTPTQYLHALKSPLAAVVFGVSAAPGVGTTSQTVDLP